jgi:hypothetical protein
VYTQKLLFLLLFFSAAVQAQDLTGIWRGHFRANELYERLQGENGRYKMEVQIAQKENRFHAITYSYLSNLFYGKADAEGNEDITSNKIRLRESKLLEYKTIGGDVCMMSLLLKYSKIGDDEFLEGTYTSVNNRDSSDCGRGTIFLHKVIVSDFYEEPFLLKREKEIENEKKSDVATRPSANKIVKKNPETDKKTALIKKPHPNTAAAPNSNKPTDHLNPSSTAHSTNNSSVNKAVLTPKKKVSPPVTNIPAHPLHLSKSNLTSQPISTVKNDSVTSIASVPIPMAIPQVLTHRSNELVKSITVRTADIELNIYDDGVIDNDTVSVYFDKKLIVSNARLSDKPIVVKLHLDETSATHELVMVAENEGDIPPNTSLMIVKAGNDQFEVRIVSTEQKNAVVVFKYQKTKE